MTQLIYVPDDAAALSVGADEVAQAISAEISRRGLDAKLIRTGSRGLLWLEPLVEFATPKGRIGYGPVSVADVAALFDDPAHARSLGLVEEIPYLKSQQRLTFARCGITDPLSLEDYESLGGLAGLRHALEMTCADIVEQVVDSGLRGRGGAGFPTGIKWSTVAATQPRQKYIICNADEGDSGTFRRSHGDGRRPVSADRRHDHRGPGSGRNHKAISISARNIRTPSPK